MVSTLYCEGNRRDITGSDGGICSGGGYLLKSTSITGGGEGGGRFVVGGGGKVVGEGGGEVVCGRGTEVVGGRDDGVVGGRRDGVVAGRLIFFLFLQQQKEIRRDYSFEVIKTCSTFMHLID